MATERVTSAILAKDYKASKQEVVQLRDELARAEENLAKIFGEKASLETKMESQMKRLRVTRSDWVRRDRKRAMESLISKYADCFGKIRRYREDTKKSYDVALMLSQISRTIGCLKFMRDDQGVAISPEEFERLDDDMARWTAKYKALDVIEVTDVDFCMTLINERFSPNSVPTQDTPIEAVPGVEQFGSNIGAVTSSNASALQTPPGSLQDVHGDPNVSFAHS